jgi:HEAT repeat protein
VRSQAAKALGEQCDSRAFEPLVAALDDDLAAPSAALALMRLGDERAIRPLIECLDPAKSLRLQSAAVRALAGLGGAGVLDRLIDVARDEDRDPGVRQAAQAEVARLSRVAETGPNPMLLWALGVALIAAALVAAATIGPLAGVPLVAGALIALVARFRATRGTSGEDGGGWGFDSPGWGDGGGADGGGGDGGSC